MIPVRGYCPLGCGSTLQLVDGAVQCVAPDCSDPLAVDTILAEGETGHLLTVLASGRYSLQHPLRERRAGELHSCELDRWLSEGPQTAPGRYRVIREGVTWRFVRLLEQAVPGG